MTLTSFNFANRSEFMPTDFDLIDKILAGYRHTGTVILHPTFSDRFNDKETEIENRLPFHYVEKGNCRVMVDGQEYLLAEGDFIAIMKGCTYQLRNVEDNTPSKTTLICGYFELPSGNSRPLMASLPDVQIIRHTDIVQSTRLKTVMLLLVEEVNSGLLGAKSAVNSLANLFFTYVLRNIIDCKTVEHGVLAGLADNQLVKALSAFHNEFHQPWNLDSLAKEAGFSRTKFVAKFRDIIGVTPGAYMTQWRMNWAASQLTSSEDIIYDIALSAGYQSDASFCRVFRQQFGLPPSEYRKLSS